MFSIGDGHARQGKGETVVPAVECAMVTVVALDRWLPEREVMSWIRDAWEGWARRALAGSRAGERGRAPVSGGPSWIPLLPY
jgi:hypothetical protein